MASCRSDNHEKIREKLKNSQGYLDGVVKTSRIFELLGEPNRMKIVLALMEGELCVYHLCEITDVKQSTCSQHLRKLKDGNIVKSRKLGNQVLYSIADDHVVTIIEKAVEHINH